MQDGSGLWTMSFYAVGFVAQRAAVPKPFCFAAYFLPARYELSPF
jgi:hypothetical protein